MSEPTSGNGSGPRAFGRLDGFDELPGGEPHGAPPPPAIAEKPPAPWKDASDPVLIGAESPLEMPDQDFAARAPAGTGPPPRPPRRRGDWVARAAVTFGAAMLTAAFASELYGVLAFVQMTPIQLVFLVLSTIAFGWIALGTLSAAMGFLPLYAGDSADTIAVPAASGPLTSRTALLFPVYHEDPARIAGTIEAMAEDLAALDRARAFEVFVLSDTRGSGPGGVEERVYADLKRHLAPVIALNYRRRRENTGRKAGNIKDWIERFGGRFEHFVILDADSVMAAETLVRLARAMEADPHAGLIQTVPRLVGGHTLLQRLQQFACNIYGRAVAAGIAFWHRDQGNYWGHNAIIRTRAFASAAGLPALPGRPPFGGHILSHDFVEAVLLQRAGWGVHMAPDLPGSYEGMPPSLVDLVVRDRRWAQGNLQHLAIVPAAGITGMGRVHMLMGASAYLVSAVWALSLAVGLVLALQGQQMIPSYFQDARSLFPIWPVIDPGAALRLFLATMAVVLLPKGFGLLLEMKRALRAREVGGPVRALAGVLTETTFSMLIAPILMVTQTVAVFQILFGIDAGWKAQRRDDGGIALGAALQFHWRHMALGAVMALICYNAYPELLAWMAPVLAGLILAGLLSWLLARPAGPVSDAILSTPEDRDPPPILVRADARAAEWSARVAAGG